ncbi:MAG: hypothetical protein WC469_05920, partial [Candidatus Omnitrophota bacterium]
LQYKASNMMNSGADRRAAQAELARRSAREAQTEQIAGNIGVAAEQAKGMAAAGQTKLEQERLKGEYGVEKAETAGQYKLESEKAKANALEKAKRIEQEIRMYGDDAKKIIAANQLPLMKDKIKQLADDSTLDAETKIKAAQIAGQWHIDAAQMKTDQLTQLLVGLRAMDSANTPEEKKEAINRLSLAHQSTPGETATPATGAETAASANAPAGGSALDANLPVYTPEQAKNLKPGIRFKGSDGKIRTT